MIPTIPSSGKGKTLEAIYRHYKGTIGEAIENTETVCDSTTQINCRRLHPQTHARGYRNHLQAANNFPYDHFHGVKYGATKADSVRKYLGEDESAILFDDNAKVQ